MLQSKIQALQVLPILPSEAPVPYNFRQHGDYTAICSSVTVLPAVFNSHYTVTVQLQCSDCAL